MNNQTILKDLVLSRRNLITYLKKLNYNVENYENFTINEINVMLCAKVSKDSDYQVELNQLNMELHDNIDETKKCKVIYYLKPTIKKGNLEKLVSEYYEENDKTKCNFIIIILQPINDTTQKTIKELWENYKEYVVIFDINSLLFNILEHNYVPKHEKLTNTEKQKLYKDMNIRDDSQVPQISILDPMAKVNLLRPGEICRITRIDKISYRNYYYRICVI